MNQVRRFSFLPSHYHRFIIIALWTSVFPSDWLWVGFYSEFIHFLYFNPWCVEINIRKRLICQSKDCIVCKTLRKYTCLYLLKLKLTLSICVNLRISAEWPKEFKTSTSPRLTASGCSSVLTWPTTKKIIPLHPAGPSYALAAHAPETRTTVRPLPTGTYDRQGTSLSPRPPAMMDKLFGDHPGIGRY